MTEYRVFGDKLINYYIDVEAADESEAFDKANEADATSWFQIEDDNVIESFSAEIKDEMLFTNS